MQKKGRYFRRHLSEDITSGKYFVTKYYSPEMLQRASRAITTKQKFISTDDFFSAKIRQDLNIHTGSHCKSVHKHICVTKSPEVLTDRKILANIRSKKHQRSVFVEDHSSIESKIQKLHKQSTQTIIKQSIQLKSKLKTKSYKNIIKAFNLYAKKKISPPQST